mgnify:FL=1
MEYSKIIINIQVKPEYRSQIQVSRLKSNLPIH